MLIITHICLEVYAPKFIIYVLASLIRLIYLPQVIIKSIVQWTISHQRKLIVKFSIAEDC